MSTLLMKTASTRPLFVFPAQAGIQTGSAGVPARILAPAKVAAIFILLCGLRKAIVIPIGREESGWVAH